ncbi:disulfide bond formation protein DsbB [Tistlia consotensis]|uniref:Disulfide bond formation protein DsbB n=2 Tax=Tistlia TaxID=1321364 RepID=A0A1Y6B837_9PROT|nr:disulfide bond formation protein DsbB [Tistlia consotensis USBA 355]SNR57183.1 disulfide bond formation protein DsbB [Tistlia consotensis]
MRKLLTDHPFLAPLIGVLAGPAALALALVGQYGFGLQPCVLCLWQRWALGISAALALPGLAAGGSLRRLSLAASGLGYLATAGIAVFHTGVERHWWQGTAECHQPTLQSALTVDQLRDTLMGTGLGSCDQIPWSLFGLSMANYDVLYSGAVALLLLAAALWLRREAAR